ncbi:hypothetical protein MUN76_11580 [Leucobacter rhizosphaerae]|uniref:Uncharacterized protein n=1 Tax=Leucobacter rhizosphaerae TaxID=2932245 RepID=A0ABY4FTU9_9MICO|nr:hypothetical protein [Leucobacter rhizosphaerae]UOQ59685.1 hypothetical protein MUN76_11580 [Leucobacter rhizosphaerae]
MQSRGFQGLPSQVQDLVLQGLDSEVESAKSKIEEAEENRPVDADLLGSLQGDIVRVEGLRSLLTSGQA